MKAIVKTYTIKTTGDTIENAFIVFEQIGICPYNDWMTAILSIYTSKEHYDSGEEPIIREPFAREPVKMRGDDTAEAAIDNLTNWLADAMLQTPTFQGGQKVDCTL